MRDVCTGAEPARKVGWIDPEPYAADVAAGGAEDAATFAEVRLKVGRWAIFSVAFALLPIGANGLSGLTRGRSVDFDGLVGRGELLLVTAAIAAAAAGELFGRLETRLRGTRLVLVGLSFLVVCVTSYWFADVAVGLQTGQPIDHHVVAVGSTYVFLLNLVVSACAVVVSEIK